MPPKGNIQFHLHTVGLSTAFMNTYNELELLSKVPTILIQFLPFLEHSYDKSFLFDLLRDEKPFKNLLAEELLEFLPFGKDSNVSCSLLKKITCI